MANRLIPVILLASVWSAAAISDLDAQSRHWAFLNGDTSATGGVARHEWQRGDAEVHPTRWGWTTKRWPTYAELPPPADSRAWWRDNGDERDPDMSRLLRRVESEAAILRTNILASAFPPGRQQDEFRKVVECLSAVLLDLQELARAAVDKDAGVKGRKP